MKFQIKVILSLLLINTLCCTKLEQRLEDSFVSAPATGNTDVGALLNGAYNSMNGLMHSQDLMFSLQETTTDEALIPTRGGDWDDNGVWRVLHAHTWTNIHAQFKSVFDALGGLQSSAITTLAFNPSPTQAAEAY